MNTNQSGEYPSQHSPEPTINVNVDAQRTLGPNREDTQKPNLTPEGELRADNTHQMRDGLKSFSGQATNHLSSQSTHRTPTPHQSAMVFRVECPGSPPQRLQLTGEIYTLGAGEGCSIRLRDPNVLPLHVTLCHQADTVVIRAHQEPVWVNGQAVGKSEIKIGDVITLGGYRFQLMSKQFISVDKRERTKITNVLPPEVERAIAESSESNTSSPTTSSVGSSSSDEQDLGDVSIQNHIDACLHQEKLCEQREEKLSNDQAKLETHQEDIAKRVANLTAKESTPLELNDQLADRQSEISSLRSMLESNKELNLEREKHFEESKTVLEEKLAIQSNELQSFQERQTNAEAEIKELSAKLAELSKELNHAQQQRDLVELREQLQRREHEHVVRQLESDRDHVIAEKAEKQAKLRRMERSIQELEALVASVDKIAFEHEEIDSATKAHEDLAEEIHNSRTLEFFDESFEPNEAISENTNELSLPLDDIEMGSIAKTVPSAVNKVEPECNDESGTLDQLDTKALAEFAELSQKNSELLTELIRIKRERDDAKREATERRSVEEVSELEAALSVASSELAKTRADYDEAISLLGKMKEQREKEKTRQQGEEKAKHDDSDNDSNTGSPNLESAAATPPLNSEPEGKPESSSKVSSAWKSLLKNLAHNKD
ncbi:MAG: FHA domain-containing protein, partial [Planctomycetota bacterium]|nr:FHA domain-containing protein [Planctomycetota bacterium]